MKYRGIHTVISGGQEGADLGGLDAGRSIGVITGGTAPKGWRVCTYEGDDGFNPRLAEYGLVEATSPAYPVRTKFNVAQSDGTLLFGYMGSRGSLLTLKTCDELGKPYLDNPSIAEFYSWAKEHSIGVLNVAGNRASPTNPEIYYLTYCFLVKAHRAHPGLFYPKPIAVTNYKH